jgi:hypothetical protein
MNLVQQAYFELFKDDSSGIDFSVKYSGKFTDYNANVRYSSDRRQMAFSLSRKWEEVSEEIQIGLIQSLMFKVIKDKKPVGMTTNIELYNIFLKKVHVAAPKTEKDPLLLESFNRVNLEYFGGSIEAPNLVWGLDTVRKLGCYTYGNDTISMSTVLRCNQELLDYVMHHEMLHKKLKFKSTMHRSIHHSREFRELEKQYLNSDELERKLRRLVAVKRIKRAWFF